MKKAAEDKEVTALFPRVNTTWQGHESAQRQFLDSWNSGRMHHAWLMTGKAGIGKATLAWRMARFVLTQGNGAQDALFGSTKPTSLDVMPDHPACRRLASGGHGDMLAVERMYDDKKGRYKNEIAVDTVRQIVPLRLTSSEGGWRVVIVDGADCMNASSQNAILKILEEPPPRTLLLLTAENAGAMLPTIRSRTRKLTLDPLPEETVVSLLEQYQPDLEPKERASLARLSEGSIGQAMALAEAGGLDLYRQMLDLLGALPHLHISEAHHWAEKFSRAGQEEVWAVVTGLMVWWLNRLLKAGATQGFPAEAVLSENAITQCLLALRPLSGWIRVRDDLQALFNKGDAANLDRKQVMLSALALLAG